MRAQPGYKVKSAERPRKDNALNIPPIKLNFPGLPDDINFIVFKNLKAIQKRSVLAKDIFKMGSVATNGASGGATTSISNQFRTRILSGQISCVMSVKFLLINEMAMMCKIADIHGMFLDMEHSSQDLHAIAQLVLACNYVGVSPIVRVPSKSHFHVSRALDAGAVAVVVPHVDSVDEARQLVQAAKFAPLGQRGSTNNQPLFDFRHVPFTVQNETLNRETMLIPMVESPAAITTMVSTDFWSDPTTCALSLAYLVNMTTHSTKTPWPR